MGVSDATQVAPIGKTHEKHYGKEMEHTELIVVRHGQANSKARNEEDYDQLSDLGHKQARWLGDYFSSINMEFCKIVSGSLKRHKGTVSGIGIDKQCHTDDRLNELRYFDMAEELLDLDGVPLPTGPSDFEFHFPKVMSAWEEGRLDHVHMTYREFQTGAVESLIGHAKNNERVLFISSGGIIDVVICHILKRKMSDLVPLMPHAINSSIHRFSVQNETLKLQSYNSTPHLDRPERRYARTVV